MILATSSTDSIDPYPTLMALMTLLAEYRDVEPEVATTKINALIQEQCGAQTQKFTFKGARLEADVNEGSPAWMTTGMRVSFLLTDEDFNIRMFEVTADFGAKIQGKFN